jgi:NAD(P)-dependent dehydrogenase (short-subunit alcohol dehydrogenase family)
MLINFSDPVVIVTGAAGSLGGATARAFAAAGARLVLVDRVVGRLAARFPERLTGGAPLLADRVEVTDEAAVSRLITSVLERFGRIDVLANAVGGYRAGQPVHETPLETWDFMFSLNAWGARAKPGRCAIDA